MRARFTVLSTIAIWRLLCVCVCVCCLGGSAPKQRLDTWGTWGRMHKEASAKLHTEALPECGTIYMSFRVCEFKYLNAVSQTIHDPYIVCISIYNYYRQLSRVSIVIIYIYTDKHETLSRPNQCVCVSIGNLIKFGAIDLIEVCRVKY